MNEFIKPTSIKDVLFIARPKFGDDRGFFRETFRKNELEEALGYPVDFVQGNHSYSRKGTLRGIHQAPWHKLITVTRGKIQAVLVDLRPDSNTFGKYESIILGEPDFGSIFVPAWIGNSFLVLSDEVDYVYSVTDYWAPGKEETVKYNDADIAVKWEMPEADLIVSDRDKEAKTLREIFPNKF